MNGGDLSTIIDGNNAFEFGEAICPSIGDCHIHSDGDYSLSFAKIDAAHSKGL